MKVFLKWVVKSFQRGLAYRLEYFVSIFNALLYMFIFTSIWKAIFNQGEVIKGLDQNLMINYAVFATLIKSTVVKSRDFIGERVRTGEISVDLTKPISLPMITLADAMGSWLFQLFSRAIPLLVFATYAFDIRYPVGLDIYFIASYILSFFIFHSLLFVFGTASFYITENFPLWILNSAAISLLSGSILPLEILPVYVQDIAIYTPYPYLFYLPTMKLLQGDFPMMHALSRQLMAMSATYLLGFALFHYGKRRLHIQGG